MFDFLEKILVALLYEQFSKRERGGIEPPTSRSAVECSTTEQRSLKQTPLIFQNVFFKTMLLA